MASLQNVMQQLQALADVTSRRDRGACPVGYRFTNQGMVGIYAVRNGFSIADTTSEQLVLSIAEMDKIFNKQLA
jgi:hypothetical protein